MPVDDRFDLLGMHFHSADIDDAASAAEEMEAATATFYNITGIDEAVQVHELSIVVQISKRSPVRSNGKRCIFDSYFNTLASTYEIVRKPCQAICNFESHSRLG